MKEHGIQNTIRNALVGRLLLWRVNVGKGWVGQVVFKPTQRVRVELEPGDVVLRKARRFDTGLPPGFSDLFGALPVVITEDMVGQTIAQFVAPEVKQPGEDAKEHQTKFHAAIRRAGGRAGVVRSVEDALQLLGLEAQNSP